MRKENGRLKGARTVGENKCGMAAKKKERGKRREREREGRWAQEVKLGVKT